MPTEDIEILDKFSTNSMYVGFIDVLGFGRHVVHDHEGTLDTYANIIKFVKHQIKTHPNVSLRVMSDSIIITGNDLASVVVAVNVIHQYTLFFDWLIRGGIAFGKHSEYSELGNIYVVSQALVLAAQIEKSIKYPCVVIHNDIEIPPLWWGPCENNFIRKILYYDGLRIVSPFNITWGLSAKSRVESMQERFPEHSDKYNWFINLYESVRREYLLLPPDIIGALELDKYALNAS